MGVNMYECIICGETKDDGWSTYFCEFLDRVRIMEERIGLNKCFAYKDIREKQGWGQILTEDVCDICFRKGAPIYEEFFRIKRTKEERRIYWKHKNKKIIKTKEDRREYWEMISRKK